MRKQITFIGYIVFALCIFPANSYAKEVPIEVGEKTIHLYYPANFTDACNNSRKMKQFVSSYVPDSYKLFTCFLETDMHSVGKEAAILQARTQKGILNENFSVNDFRKIRQTIVENQESMLKNILPKAKASFGKAATESLKQIGSKDALSIDGIVPLGVFSNTNRNIAFAVLRNLSTQSTDHRKSTQSEIDAVNVVLMANKVIELQVSKNVNTPDDIETAKDLALSWGRLNTR